MGMSRTVALAGLGSILLVLLFGQFSSAEALRGLGEVSTGTGYLSPLPLPVKGECRAGDKYVINSMKDLYDNADQLDCIFAAGLEPGNVPLGFGYGYVLTTVNTGFYAKFAQLPYQGDFVVKTQCGGNFYNIGWLSIAGMDVGTSVWTVDNLGWEMADGEMPEGDKKSILMDFTVNFEELCAAEGNESPLGLMGFSPFKSSIFPLSAFKDIGRVVGVDTDGGTVMLNKALIQSEGLGAQTVLFYAVKTFDVSVRPAGFVPGVELEVPLGPNGETVMEYKRQALDGLIARTLGVLFDPAMLAGAVGKREIEHTRKVAESLGQGPLGISPFKIGSVLAAFGEAMGSQVSQALKAV
eukprot:GHVS01028250.1.p1 GENE.GHVS01028250.1~~GHVS01028250.1.p1  ORF type:complete len:353 (+),score=60.61 GHVS01028250.1:204-1262(+)